jgi:predicted Zn-dependent peptidase
MEHLICQNFEYLRPKFEKYGIEWNASTSQNEVIFYFTGLDKYLNQYKYELVNLITDFKSEKKDFELEKKIILQEYTNTFSEQSECHTLNLERKLFGVYDAIGLREDLEALSFMDCIDYFEKQFSNPSKIINVSKYNKFTYDGEFNQNLIDKSYKFGPYRNVILEPTKNFGDRVSVQLISNLSDKDFAYNIFIANMLNLGLSSPFYSVLREKLGLVYGISTKHIRMNDQGYTIISAKTSEKNSKKLVDSIEEILKNQSKFLTKERFEIIKNYYTIKYQKDRINRYNNVNDWVYPKEWSIKDILPTITFEKVIELYEQNFKFDNFYKSIDKLEFV